MAFKSGQPSLAGGQNSSIGLNALPGTNSSSSSQSSLDMTGYVGSVVWMAPEVMKSKNVVYDQAVDVFSYAMVYLKLSLVIYHGKKQKMRMKCLIT